MNIPPYLCSTKITRVKDRAYEETEDLLAVEEPLEIRLGYGAGIQRQEKPLSVTMRTPGHDLELVAGFLFTEGIIHERKALLHVQHCESTTLKPEEKGNVVKAALHPEVAPDWEKLKRYGYSHSSCGICGKSSIAAVGTSCSPIQEKGLKVKISALHGLSEKLRQKQRIFSHTGGLHAAGLYDSEGNLLLLREDIGRHNALDKLIGAAFLKNTFPLKKHIILLSGRVSFEMIQKSLMAQAPFVVAIGAPSSLAVNLAKSYGQTLLGFMRNGKFNIYSGKERIYHDETESLKTYKYP